MGRDDVSNAVFLSQSDRILQGGYSARRIVMGLLDRALDLLSQCLRGGLFSSLRLHLLGGVDRSPPFDVFLPRSPYCGKVSMLLLSYFLAWSKIDPERLTGLLALGVLL